MTDSNQIKGLGSTAYFNDEAAFFVPSTNSGAPHADPLTAQQAFKSIS